MFFLKKGCLLTTFLQIVKKKWVILLKNNINHPLTYLKKTPISLKSLLCKTSCAVCQKQ